MTPSASCPASPRREKVISAHQMMIPKAYEVYPARLPSAPDIPKRPVNVLRPPPPLKRTPVLETVEPHWINQMRSNRMKQREHYRYHNAWSKYYYGSVSDKEEYRHYLRSVLKQQMSDREQRYRDDHLDRIKESAVVTERDNHDRQTDAEKFRAKFEVLKSFRDENKKLMEYVWEDRRQQKQREDVFDREQLRYNPINWSCTLK